MSDRGLLGNSLGGRDDRRGDIGGPRQVGRVTGGKANHGSVDLLGHDKLKFGLEHVVVLADDVPGGLGLPSGDGDLISKIFALGRLLRRRDQLGLSGRDVLGQMLRDALMREG